MVLENFKHESFQEITQQTITKEIKSDLNQIKIDQIQEIDPQLKERINNIANRFQSRVNNTKHYADRNVDNKYSKEKKTVTSSVSYLGDVSVGDTGTITISKYYTRLGVTHGTHYNAPQYNGYAINTQTKDDNKTDQYIVSVKDYDTQDEKTIIGLSVTFDFQNNITYNAWEGSEGSEKPIKIKNAVDKIERYMNAYDAYEEKKISKKE